MSLTQPQLAALGWTEGADWHNLPINPNIPEEHADAVRERVYAYARYPYHHEQQAPLAGVCAHCYVWLDDGGMYDITTHAERPDDHNHSIYRIEDILAVTPSLHSTWNTT